MLNLLSLIGALLHHHHHNHQVLLLLLLGIALFPECGARIILDDGTHERMHVPRNLLVPWEGRARSAPRPIPSFDRDSAPVPLPEFPTLGPPMVWSFPAPPLPSSSPPSHHIVPIYPGIKHPSPPPTPLSPPPERRHRKKHCSYNNSPPPPPPIVTVVAAEPVTYPGYTIEAPESAPQPVAGGPIPPSSS